MPPGRGRRGIGLLAIVLLAITLRCGAMVYVDALRLPTGENGAIARNLIEGNGFSFTQFGRLGPTSVRGPVYPITLAGLYSIFGTTHHTAQIAVLALNTVAAGASVLLAFFFVRSLINPRTAWIAAILFAVWPTQVYAAALVQGLCLGVLFALASLRFAGQPKPLYAIAAGICGALAMLTEPILVLPLLFVAILIGRRFPGRALLMIAAATLLVFPWVLRNSVVHHQFVGITDTFWPDTFRGNGPDASGSEHLRLVDRIGKPLSQMDRLPPQRTDALKAETEIGKVRLFRAWTTEWIGANPAAYAKLCGVRIVKTLWLDWDHPLAKRWIDLLIRTLALGGFIAALFIPLPRGVKLSLCAFASGLILATLFSMAEARTAVFIDVPQLIALAACVEMLWRPKELSA